MLDRDYRDIAAGSVLMAIGTAASIYAATHYSMGTVTRMGPGMVPVWLGIALAVFGLAIALPAAFRRGIPVAIPVRPFIAMSIAILGFTLLITVSGLVPAVFVTAFAATFAERQVSMVSALMLGAGMALLTWAVFILALGLPIPAFGGGV